MRQGSSKSTGNRLDALVLQQVNQVAESTFIDAKGNCTVKGRGHQRAWTALFGFGRIEDARREFGDAKVFSATGAEVGQLGF